MTNIQPTVKELVPLVDVHDGKHQRNYTRSVVCEFRFPTLLSLAGAEPPKSFVTALRRSYPKLELAKEVSIGLGDAMPSAHSHILRSKNMSWTITLKKDSIALETSRYSFYKDLRERVEELLSAISPVIDTDYFTRIGLRYVNLVVTDGKTQLSEWINPVLVGVTETGFNGISESAGRLGLHTEGGGCLLQHGIKAKESDQSHLEVSNSIPNYILDIDSYREDVTSIDALDVLDEMRQQAYSLFSWSLGPKGKEHLLKSGKSGD